MSTCCSFAADTAEQAVEKTVSSGGDKADSAAENVQKAVSNIFAPGEEITQSPATLQAFSLSKKATFPRKQDRLEFSETSQKGCECR